MTNSVFEDSGDGPGQFPDYPGGVTPLPGTLGSVPQSVSHTPLPREAPRAVFDEDEQEPAPMNHPGLGQLVNRPKSSVGSDHNKNQPGLFFLVFCFMFSFKSLSALTFPTEFAHTLINHS